MVSVSPAYSEAGVGDTARVDIIVENVAHLYAADVHLYFDAGILQVQDANPTRSGVQIEPGPFLDPGTGWLFKNTADNDAGHIWFVITLTNPAPPVSGDGTLFSVTFQGEAAGTSQLSLREVQLVSLVEGKVDTITSATEGGTIVVTP